MRFRAAGAVAVAVLALAACAASLTSPGASSPAQGPGSAAPLESATLEPTRSPSLAPSFAPIMLSGKGNKVPRFTIPEDEAAIATITNKGSANFMVTSLAADGSDNELLVNEIGNYSGTVLFDASSGQHSVAFKVESDGTWAITIQPLSAAKVWDPTTPLAGRGDDVIAVSPAVSGLMTATISHKGQANFVVYAYSPSGQDLLVNEIGNFSGEEAVPDGTYLLQINADGTWTVTPT
jgi:hypothetical protein